MTASDSHGTSWIVSEPAEEKRRVCPSLTDFNSILTCLGAAANSAYATRLAAPVVFQVFVPAHDNKPDMFLNFFNWKINYDTQDPEYFGEGDVIEDDDGEPVLTDDGEKARDELWEQITDFDVTFYNKGDADIVRDPGQQAGASRDTQLGQAREDESVRIEFTVREDSFVTPSDLSNPQGATAEDASDVFGGDPYAPRMRFEQQDGDGAFLKPGSARFDAMDAEDEEIGRVIVQHHLADAYMRLRKAGLGADMARDIVQETFKNDIRFDPGSFDAEFGDSGFGSEATTWVMAPTYGMGLVVHNAMLLVHSLREPMRSRRAAADPPPEGPAKAQKRRKTEQALLSRRFRRLGVEAEVRIKKCAFCQLKDAIAVCDQCGSAAYCGLKCQTLAWNVDGHKRECRPQ